MDKYTNRLQHKVTLSTTWFNIKTFYIQLTEYIYVFCMDLRTNSEYFPIQH